MFARANPQEKLRRGFGQNEGEWARMVKNSSRKKSLAAREARIASFKREPLRWRGGGGEVRYTDVMIRSRCGLGIVMFGVRCGLDVLIGREGFGLDFVMCRLGRGSDGVMVGVRHAMCVIIGETGSDLTAVMHEVGSSGCSEG